MLSWVILEAPKWLLAKMASGTACTTPATDTKPEGESADREKGKGADETGCAS